MEQNKYVITDKIKFAALEEVFNHFVEQRKGTKAQSPAAYCREVNEYTTEMVAYIIDNYRGEELCAVLAHFVPKFVKNKHIFFSLGIYITNITFWWKFGFV